jgi:hypothetical protein
MKKSHVFALCAACLVVGILIDEPLRLLEVILCTAAGAIVVTGWWAAFHEEGVMFAFIMPIGQGVWLSLAWVCWAVYLFMRLFGIPTEGFEAFFRELHESGHR